MKPAAVSLADHIAFEAPDFDALALQTPDVDTFCSSTAWTVPAHAAFHANTATIVARSGNSCVSLARGSGDGLGQYLMPTEGVWTLASPVVGPDAHENVEHLLTFLEREPHGATLALITGIEVGSTTETLLVSGAKRQVDAVEVRPVTRHVASLDGGVDRFLGRRSRKFRANLRRIMRRANEAAVEVTVQSVASQDQLRSLYSRALNIEFGSWKTATGNGVAMGPMKAFTRGVLGRALAAGDTPVFLFAQRDGQDVGYLHGVLRGTYFRGLQMSFDDRHRNLSLGNVLQWSAIQHLAERHATDYDLGSTVPYKALWSEGHMTTSGIFLRL
jgi:hypothetical protein